jgi:hypothetical protein
MKKILTIGLFMLLATGSFAQRTTLTKCFLSLEVPKGWIKKESTDSLTGEYNCTFLGDTLTSTPALAFFPPLMLKTTFIDTSVVDAKTLRDFFAKEFPAMSNGYKQIGVTEEVIDNHKFYKLEYTLPKDGVENHLITYFYDSGVYSVSMISLIDTEAGYKKTQKIFAAAVASIKFM